ncbi:MAG: bifunctional diaminohydroxyphosphoribosylaminopyrimidine deaminase/5-amino-6-(5-phosphoribosylamino)uracil reductase RibD [Gammaproteobacteria bacterium]|nr:bifunctional diaminohydroxyphosphoribosylaminopyrimidine deaminase/5-amino-6-(5-phosphoribosylamino)uracil reductase RibD [Gammaproteobacteria bacterium]
MEADYRFMARAIKLARQGLYTTHPNPRVGCVLVRDGKLVGEGYHRYAGEPHAEPNALRAAGTNARGATGYVTLEPCCHQGRTPACTEALIEAGVSRVVAAMRDPNPLVAGAGFKRLRQAGVDVVEGVLEAESAQLNPGFIKRMQTGRPYVRCKLAMSLDGKTAMASGESQWITGTAARLDVQRLRARSDAIVTGIGTVLADDPSMNVRIAGGSVPGIPKGNALRQPLRVVLDSRLQMPASAKMIGLKGDTLIVSLIAGSNQPLLNAVGAEVMLLPGSGNRIDLGLLLDQLGGRQINEVLIESGPTLAGGFLAAGLVDELMIYAAPHIMGDNARGLLQLPGLDRMQDRISLEITDLRMVGKDIRLTAKPLTG